jgi:hypothetical protein
MPVRMTDRRFGRRYLLGNLLLLVPTSVAFLVLWQHASALGTVFWVALAIFALGIAALIVSQWVQFRSYRCPACGAKLTRKVGDEPTAPVLYPCPTCDVEWDVGIRLSES